MIRRIGYWCTTDEENKYPDPSKLQDADFWKVRSKGIVAGYLKNGYPCNYFRGYARCRICNQHLGTHERTDGVWCWPDMLEHYILYHDVVLPHIFLAHIELSPVLTPYQIGAKLEEFEEFGAESYEDGVDKFYHFHPDDAFWIDWGSRIS